MLYDRSRRNSFPAPHARSGKPRACADHPVSFASSGPQEGTRDRCSNWRLRPGLLLFAGLFSAGIAASAEPDPSHAATDQRVSELEARVETLAAELSDAITASVVPPTDTFDPVWGVGPAASKVYGENEGLSIGGYGEVRFRHNSRKDDVFDALRAVLYVGYKFDDQWVLNSEFEFEHGGGSDVYTEFLNLDYLHSDSLNFRVGLILIPMGFLNQLHEPNFYYGAERPEVEKRIIPTTWRENGMGLYGRLGESIRYQLYLVNSLDGQDFDASGFRGGRQKGMKAIANDFSVVLRTDMDLSPGLLAGFSVYYGNQGQDQVAGSLSTPVGSLSTAIYELHAEYRRRGLSIRMLFAQAFVDNPDSLNVTKTGNYLAESLLGGYAEIAYDVMPLFRSETKSSLEPFFRYERLDTQWRMQSAAFAPTAKYDKHIYTAGLQWKPIPRIVLKLDYRYVEEASSGNALAKEFEFGVGYVF